MSRLRHASKCQQKNVLLFQTISKNNYLSITTTYLIKVCQENKINVLLRIDGRVVRAGHIPGTWVGSSGNDQIFVLFFYFEPSNSKPEQTLREM
jgi:hypothetical protein